MLDRHAALQTLRTLRAPLQARGVKHASLFGSVARSEMTAASDVDVVITPAGNVPLDLFSLGSVQSLLEEAFAGYTVDVLMTPIARSELRENIERERLDAF